MNYPDFNEIKRVCDGMMKPEVYQKIYELAYNAKGNNFIEVGSAHGAATVCLALGLKNSGKESGTVFTFDTFEGGGREAYKNSVQENKRKLENNLKYFKVTEYVKIIEGDVSKTNILLKDHKSFDLMMLDSDGQIDRDFGFFYQRIKDGAPIIIDDCFDRARITISKIKPNIATIDQKHKLTNLLTKSAENSGLIKEIDFIYQTWFGRKESEKNIRDWNETDILNCYKSLVFSKGEVKYK